MQTIAVKRRQDTRLPRWLVYGVVGIGLSWGVAIADWAAVEVGATHRQLRWMPTFSLGAVNEVVVAIHKSRHPQETEYVTRPYGWPFGGWGSVLARQWMPGGQARCNAVTAIDVSGIWPSQNGTAGCFDRFVPVCPLLGPLIVDAAFWGALCWGVFGRRSRVRIGSEVPCGECRYNLVGLPAESLCPECGEHR